MNFFKNYGCLIDENEYPLIGASANFTPLLVQKNENELEFKEGDVIKLTQHLNGNWAEGRLYDKLRTFPCGCTTLTLE